MSLLVTGTIGVDSIITPTQKRDRVLGGSAVYFAFAALQYTEVRVVGVVGEDFPHEYLTLLGSRNLDLSGLEVRAGSKSFSWSARYEKDMNERETLETNLNVLEEAPPEVPAAFADSDIVFLANAHPALQRRMRAAFKNPRLTVGDTMNLWIETARDELVSTLGIVDGLILNDGEARQLTERHNLIDAGQALLDCGPRFVVIKKGEHGAMLVTRDATSVIPAFPTANVVDPTGAGDSFAGGMLGYLCTQHEIDYAALRRSLVRGTVAASFTIEDFSLGRVQHLEREEVDRRVAEFVEMLCFD
jgi:sugar/nucleoside kinase (ribokinase family)